MLKRLVLLCVLALAAPAVAQTPVFDHQPPVLPKVLHHPSILVLTKANGYVHDNMPFVARAVAKIAAQHRWTIYETTNAATFNTAQLKRFDVVVLNNSTGDLFTEDQRAAFKAWIESGGRVVALHGAGGTDPSPWPWFSDTVIGARFIGHPQIQPATLRIEDPTNPIVANLPVNWAHTDEWYSFDRDPRGPDTHVLAAVDEKTYVPTDKLAMGADHPTIWTRCVAKGGAFFTAIGHQPENWSDPVFLSHIDGAMKWAVDRKQKAC